MYLLHYIKVAMARFSIVKLAGVPEKENYHPIDWKECVLCQEDKEEKLMDSRKNDNTHQPFKGYESLTQNLEPFHDICQLPPNIKG